MPKLHGVCSPEPKDILFICLENLGIFGKILKNLKFYMLEPAKMS